MKIISGTITDITEGIICHQTNCKKVAGTGLALAIRNKYTNWYKEFRLYDGELGMCWLYDVNDKLTIASLYAQNGYGRDIRFTEYWAFRNCLKALKKQNGYDKQIYIPAGIGCRNAGGDWNIIEKLIEEYLPDSILIAYN